ncbi:hypothetical protein O159_21420 [Leifsonia xyli subsp. cynodontis DSM 46306]|uniref:DUF1023 domain-containing protein n=1 Tax=Leifsonia xyli subsp. cynodontis DSM 46306 TaxID=1389489 RepID=U3P8C4_LEIXC|nr:hypothetical protein O159_20780 [Leifsonia xyli subsp. cynodontis DSM 46306]AGW42123.1 hypothetical protein O159_21420 [Leifsonia xyli subsp. cynodontis DSM 46306]
MVRFDEAVAMVLIRVCRGLDEELRGEGVLRRGAVETAVHDFSGRYAGLFTAAAVIEAADRGRLAGVLYSLAEQVEAAVLRVGEERKRQRDLSGWREREAGRERRRATADALGVVGAGIDGFFDPRSSEVAVRPPVVSAAFSPRERNRTSGGASSGRSSAVPDRLRVFVSRTRASDAGMARRLVALRDAWSAFVASCSWVPVESATFLYGFERLLAESRADALWIEQVAAAFDAAGGGTLSDHALDLVATAVHPLSDEGLLAAFGTLTAVELRALLAASPVLRARLSSVDPVAVDTWWHGLGPAVGAGGGFSARQELLLTAFPDLFGNVEGIPYAARDEANRRALAAAIAGMEKQIAGLRARVGDSSVVDGPLLPGVLAMKHTLRDAEEQLKALKNIRAALQTREGRASRFLIALTGDRPPLAAVAIGDLDTATTVSYAVPGMGTTTHGMTGWAKAAQNLYALLPVDSAVVAWIGYKTPPSPSVGDPDFGVLNVNRAVAGGTKLASTLGGLGAVRGGALPRLSVVAHSYGTTTAAVALSQPGVRVDTFVTLGSAGLPDSVRSVADLNAGAVYSGHARDKFLGETESGDPWAWIGRDGSRDHRVNPLAPDFGSQAFGVETGGDSGSSVTDHGPLLSDDGPEAGYFDYETESLANTARAVSGKTGSITPYAPLGPTNFQKGLQVENEKGCLCGVLLRDVG